MNKEKKDKSMAHSCTGGVGVQHSIMGTGQVTFEWNIER